MINVYVIVLFLALYVCSEIFFSHKYSAQALDVLKKPISFRIHELITWTFRILDFVLISRFEATFVWNLPRKILTRGNLGSKIGYVYLIKILIQGQKFFQIGTRAKKIYGVESLNSACCTDDNNCIRVAIVLISLRLITSVTDLYCAIRVYYILVYYKR